MYAYRLIICIISFLFIISQNSCYAKTDPITTLSKKYKYIILSIDGGGVRGIIPARILQEIEHRTSKQIHEMFDLISGNSTGGIIALALVTPDQSKRQALHTAKDLVELYRNRSKEIFHKSYWWQIKTGAGLWGARYDRSNLDKILEEKFGDASLSDTLKPVMAISYSLDRGEVHLWTNRIARMSHNNDFFLKDIAAATSAAPTYFAPKILMNKQQQYCYCDNQTNMEKLCYEADGGIFANNPGVLAISEAYREVPSLMRHDILLVSIGTGSAKMTAPIVHLKDSGIISWVMKANLIDVMMNSENEITEWEIGLDTNTIRLQVNLSKDLGAMDNASEENIQMLIKTTEEYIQNNNRLIDALCERLSSFRTN